MSFFGPPPRRGGYSSPFGPFYGYPPKGVYDEDDEDDEEAAYRRARQQQARRPQFTPSPFGSMFGQPYDEEEEYRRQQELLRQQQLRQMQAQQAQREREAQARARQEHARRQQELAQAQAQAQLRAQQEVAAQYRAQQEAAARARHDQARRPSPPATTPQPAKQPAPPKQAPAPAKQAASPEEAAKKIQHAYKAHALRSGVDEHLPALSALRKIRAKHDVLIDSYLADALSTPLVFQPEASGDSTKLQFTAKENRPFLVLEDGLLKLLIDLDGVSAGSSQEIRRLRKGMVAEIQAILDKLDGKKKSDGKKSESKEVSEETETEAEPETTVMEVEEKMDSLEEKKEQKMEEELSEKMEEVSMGESPMSEAGMDTESAPVEESELKMEPESPSMPDLVSETERREGVPPCEAKGDVEAAMEDAGADKSEDEVMQAATPILELVVESDGRKGEEKIATEEEKRAEPAPVKMEEAKAEAPDIPLPGATAPAAEARHANSHMHHKHHHRKPAPVAYHVPIDLPPPLKQAPRQRSQPPPMSPDAVRAPQPPNAPRQHPAQQFHQQAFPFSYSARPAPEPEVAYRRMPSPQPQLPPGYYYDPYGQVYRAPQQRQDRGRPRSKVVFDPRTGAYYRVEDEPHDNCGIQ